MAELSGSCRPTGLFTTRNGPYRGKISDKKFIIWFKCFLYHFDNNLTILKTIHANYYTIWFIQQLCFLMVSAFLSNQNLLYSTVLSRSPAVWGPLSIIVSITFFSALTHIWRRQKMYLYYLFLFYHTWFCCSITSFLHFTRKIIQIMTELQTLRAFSPGYLFHVINQHNICCLFNIFMNTKHVNCN